MNTRPPRRDVAHPVTQLALVVLLLVWPFAMAPGFGQAVTEATAENAPGEALVQQYFAAQTAQIRDAAFTGIETLSDWQTAQPQLRQQLIGMLGLDPWPDKTPLQATTTKISEHEDFRVECVHFQSRPGLYVTGNLYLPKGDGPFPTILYGCGHGAEIVDGVSYGNKVHYQHHGAWFARNGYVCLVIDSLQLGEILATHHGTHRLGMWWWVNRGFTPAGVEAWNCVRALDYLESRGEVDATRIGVTGRSGGGIYSWWIAAIDPRVQVAVPVAGITDMQNQVVDGCIEGHCDCMFQVNAERWDFPMIAALVAPRPLLISNTDRDSIFPLDGVVRTHQHVRRIYELHNAGNDLALHVTAGPHKDTQELRIHAFRWFNHYLRGTDQLIDQPATPEMTKEQLQVFSHGSLPSDQLNTTIHESFIEVADVQAPQNPDDWPRHRERMLDDLRTKTFGGWPKQAPPTTLHAVSPAVVRDDVQLQLFEFESQAPYRLPLLVVRPAAATDTKSIALRVVDETQWPEIASAVHHADPELAKRMAIVETPDAASWQPLHDAAKQQAYAFVLPRGVGPTRWNASPRKQIHYRRRFHLLGQTLDGMRVWDTRRAIQALRQTDAFSRCQLSVEATGNAAGIALYASLFEPPTSELRLKDLPRTHRGGPYLMNVRRTLDMPQTVALAVERQPVILANTQPEDWATTLRFIQEFENRNNLRIEHREK